MEEITLNLQRAITSDSTQKYLILQLFYNFLYWIYKLPTVL